MGELARPLGIKTFAESYRGRSQLIGPHGDERAKNSVALFLGRPERPKALRDKSKIVELSEAFPDRLHFVIEFSENRRRKGP